MQNKLDEIIALHASDPSSETERQLNETFLGSTLLVPILGPISREGDQHDIPVLCLKSPEGIGGMPVFTSLSHLYEWKPQGQMHIAIGGRKALELALSIKEISEVWVNISGVPRGRIPRYIVETMLLTA